MGEAEAMEATCMYIYTCVCVCGEREIEREGGGGRGTRVAGACSYPATPTVSQATRGGSPIRVQPAALLVQPAALCVPQLAALRVQVALEGGAVQESTATAARARLRHRIAAVEAKHAALEPKASGVYMQHVHVHVACACICVYMREQSVLDGGLHADGTERDGTRSPPPPLCR